MPKLIDIQDFLDLRSKYLTIDVRSPKEFLHGHIPEAINLPLFNDTERAKVGTIYKQVSKEAAITKGLEIVGPKMSGFVKKVSKWCPEKKVIVHCWRGGKRSGSFAWLLELVGFEVYVIEGGYKKYRNFVLDNLNNLQLKLIVIGGKTGSGKTEILRNLPSFGEQIIDLESLANHKGSAFGWIGEEEQPTNEHFENLLFHTILSLDKNKRIWVENESRTIGSVFIPEQFWSLKKNSPIIQIVASDEDRLKKLISDYAQSGKEVLKASFKKIEKKLGNNHYQQAIQMIENEDYIGAAKIALDYYDKTYQFSLLKNNIDRVYEVQIENQDTYTITQNIIKVADELE